MTPYRISESHAGAGRTVVVTSPDEATRVVLALRGATLLSWRTIVQGRETELTDGYLDEAELLAQDGVRNGLLAPFPNRVADGRYRFGGRDHDLLPGRHQGRTIYHGFAREAPFELVESTVSAESARLRLRTDWIRPSRYPGYPYSIDREVIYVISRNEIDIEMRATNVGTGPAPYAAGWHPYFSLSKPIDDLVLLIPADTIVRTDDALIPLAGESGFLPLDQCPAMDFRKPRPLGGAVIDACFAGLETGPDGRTETVLSDPATGTELRVWQFGGFMHVFTGDTLMRNRRDSIALEPVEVITNAFNRSEYAQALRIEPGERRQFRFGVTCLTQ